MLSLFLSVLYLQPRSGRFRPCSPLLLQCLLLACLSLVWLPCSGADEKWWGAAFPIDMIIDEPDDTVTLACDEEAGQRAQYD